MINLGHSSFQAKLVLIFTVIAVLLSISIGFLFFNKTKDAVDTSKENELKTLSVETADKIDRFIFERYGDIQVMANSPLLKDSSISSSLKLEYLENVRQAYKTYDYILITGNNGENRLLSGKMNDNNYYKNFLQYVLKDNIYVSDIGDSNSIYFAAPIKADDGSVIGAVIEKMNFEAIDEIVKNVHTGKLGYAYLSDEKGHTIFNPNTHTINANFKENNPYYLSSNNIDLVLAFHPISKYNTQNDSWFLVVEDPVSDAFTASYQLMDYTIIVTIILTLVLLTFGIILSRRVGQSFNLLATNLKSMMQQVLDISGEAASLSQVRQYADKFFDSMPGAVITMDITGKITGFSKAASSITGIQSQQVLGSGLEDLSTSSIKSIMNAMMDGINNETVYIKHIVRILDVSGSEIPIMINTSLQKDNNGRMLGVVGVFRSVEEIKKLEESILRAKSLEALGTLSAGMAHEIGNPLTSIKGYAQYVNSELDDKSKLKDDIMIIINEVDRLNNIVKRFLAFARPKTLKLELCCINDIMKSVIKLVEKDMPVKNIKIITNYSQVPDCFIDPEQMEQAILNIVLNSLQAMTGSGILEVSTGYMEQSSLIEVVITDTGIGIKPEDYDKIFEPFYTTKDKGTGLGLAISSRIIESHKGFIEVNSILGRGTRFIIGIPLNK